MSGKPQLYDVPTIITFGIKGGVGKSQETKRLVDSLGRHHRIALIDADIDSPNLPDLLGVTELMQLNLQRDFIPAKYGDNVEVFSMRLYMNNEDQAFTQSGDQNVQIIRDGLYYTKWTDPEYVVVDLPAGSSDELRSIMLNLNNLLGMVVVTLPNTVADLRRVLEISSFFNIPILGVVENMAYVVCPCDCGTEIPLFSDGSGSKIQAVCEESGVPYLGREPYLTELHSGEESKSPVESEATKKLVEEIYARRNKGHVREAQDGPVLDQSDAEPVPEEEHSGIAS